MTVVIAKLIEFEGARCVIGFVRNVAPRGCAPEQEV